MRITLIITVLLSIQLQAQELKDPIKFENTVKVLNMGTFHMGYTPDATTTEFDEHDQRNIEEVHQIAQSIAEFKPTVIIVETLPDNNEVLENSYKEYQQNPGLNFKNPSEVELLAFEVGRLAGANRIYGIDFKEGYNYRIGEKINNNYGFETYQKYFSVLDSLQKQYPEEKMSLLQKLQINNNPIYKDMLLNLNADMLTHISTEGNAEGADEAAKFYHRNLVMYSNLNQIELDENDRVFILMGATHTAFFDMWLKRSPKYETINIDMYLE
ncbi:DUF5694 domain-containing protein [Mesonia maritima]|uniref:TraB/GumN family protein n=1 Tax=Mesonia maritima TaxID=1793873 RepID=A0ABU1KCJ9_9FLAO|nr:DUF5694 domain-containing protein [Mesonia maritima]MDR6302192.1 hypothetical protein [Mesonia maritima]